ncbi:unnamed protein product [Kluyveromyces dobzhanskii CBS 2104]|uniref:Nuclear fusion protein KAR5 n=1 Tax=Kluyveromyces dobzhanskii CBS 2104 TaxID=1427455 RepID=A0A0A8LC67_9SACH|nr:unnamed protein product [Kluyveromyces dobzhanskii CBS 2104]
MRFIFFRFWVASGQLLPHISEVIKRSIDKPPIVELSRDYINSRFPITETGCAKKALKEFLEICSKKGIEFVDTDLRVLTAIHLSVCEFESSGSKNYPTECSANPLSELDAAECVTALESSPQWWTTYSGNYQNLPQICMENSLPYEKEQLLELFLNITGMYSDLQENVTDYWNNFHADFENSGKRNLDTLQSLFDLFIQDLLKAHETRNREASKELSEMQQFFDAHLFNFSESLNDLNFVLNEELSYIKSNLFETFQEVELENMKRSQESKKMTDETLSDLKSIKVQSATLQNKFMDDFDVFYTDLVKASRDKNLIISDELMQTQEEIIHVMFQFNKMMHESVIPLLTEELLPAVNEVSSSIVENLNNIQRQLNLQMEDWSSSIETKFQSLEEKTQESLNSAKKVESSLLKINKLAGTSLQGLQNILPLLNFLFRRQIFLLGILQILFGKYIPMKLYVYAVSILSTAAVGSKVGLWWYSFIYNTTKNDS